MKKLLLLSIMFLPIMALFAQKTIKGKVTDENGTPIPRASVLVKETKQGGTADDNGDYSITVDTKAKTLIFTAINMADQEITIGNKSVINIILKTADKNLSEVVITGYTSAAKSKSTVSSSVISSKDISNVPLTSVNDVLQGKASGLTVMSTTGQPGGGSSVRVRGVGSITAGASPIYVIDGVIVQQGQFVSTNGGFTQNNDILSNLNPNDIESVTVLKDASALALYGARGGNGVIVINTKRGKSGDSKINFTSQYGTVKPSFGNFGEMDAKQVYNYERNVLAVDGFSQAVIDANYPTSLLDKTFDWLNAGFRPVNTQSYDLSISGGNEKTKEYLSLGYYNQEGSEINSGFKRYSANFNLDHQVNNFFKITMNLNNSYSDALNGDGGSFYSSPILGAIWNSPLWLYPYRDDGSLYSGSEIEFSKGSGNTISGDNFLYSNAHNYDRARQYRGIGKITGDLKIKNWLHLKESINGDLVYARLKSFFDPTTQNGINPVDPNKSGEIDEFLTNAITITNQTSLSGNFKIKGNHEFDYLALMEYQKFHQTTMSASGLGIVDPTLQVLNVTGTPNFVGGAESEYSFLSYLGQVNYTFNRKYSFSASIRNDGSSVFGANNRFATFWSVGGSWKVIDEPFMQNQKLFKDLRLRASYGTSGVADFNVAGLGYYVARQLYAYGQTYSNSPGSAPSTPGNTNLTWEKNNQLDIGLEFGILNNRLKGTIDFYRKINSDLIQAVPVTRTSGFSTAPQNVGKMENEGFEVSLNSTNISTKNFTWTTDFNISYNKNKVLTLYNHQDIPGGTLARTSEGQPLGYWFLPVWAGVNPANGDPLWYLADGKTTTNSYATASQTANRKNVGSSFPKYTIGLSNSISYKSFGVSFLFYSILGSKVYDQTLSLVDADGTYFGLNYYKDADKNYWTTPGQTADRPKPVIGGNKNSASPSSRWIESNNYLRLRNVTFSYTLPRAFTSKAKLSSVRVFVNAVNLWTLTNYKGMDPENALGGNDVFKYPVPKSITGGIDISL